MNDTHEISSPEKKKKKKKKEKIGMLYDTVTDTLRFKIFSGTFEMESEALIMRKKLSKLAYYRLQQGQSKMCCPIAPDKRGIQIQNALTA